MIKNYKNQIYSKTMPTIKIIDKLKLDSHGVKAKKHLIHKRQGDIDGACATYSTMMCLLIIGVLESSDLDIYKKHNKTFSKGRLIRDFCESHGLHRGGKDFEEIATMLRKSYASKVTPTWHETKNEDSIELIRTEIDNDNPVIISVGYSKGAHALLAIGYESIGGSLSKVLCLDPGYPAPKCSYWNSAVDVLAPKKGKIYLYEWINNDDNENRAVTLTDIITVEKKPIKKAHEEL
jgi:hypothetical protein